MRGKYTNYFQFLLARIHRARTLRVISKLVEWKPLEQPKPGYTIVLGCNTPLAEMLATNLLMLRRQRLKNLDRIIVVFDRPKHELAMDIERDMRAEFPELPLEFIYYTELQSKVSRGFKRPWVYCWLSWMIGLAAARTKYCVLHDFDAMIIDPDFMETRYEAISTRGAQYCGVRDYIGNGVEFADCLRVTFELMFDLEFVRRTFRPIELANTIGWYKGRTVDFDIFLYAQSKAGEGFVLEVPEDDMVHPQQMISQFTDLMEKDGWIPPDENRLLLVPYFLFVADRPQLMNRMRDALVQITTGSGPRKDTIPFFGKQMNVSRLSVVHADWLAKQAFRLEHALVGQVRPEVAEYFNVVKEYVRTRARGQVLVPAGAPS